MGKRKSQSAVWCGHLQDAMKTPAPPTTRGRAEIEADIAAISEELKGPMHNVMRLDLIETRSHLRNQLAAIAPVT